MATLFLVGGSRLEEIHRTLPEDTHDTVNTKYKKAIHRLTQYFNPKRNTTIEIFKFCQAKQTNEETVEQFVTRLRLLSTFCEFADVNKEIVKQVIQTCTSKKLRRDLLKTDDIELTKLLKISRAHDTVEAQARLIEQQGDIDTLYVDMIKTDRKSTNIHKYPYKNNYKPNKFSNKSTKIDSTTKDTCYYCGRSYPHKGKCPAEGATCHSCGKSNHFSNVCRSKNQDQPKTNNRNQKPSTKVNEIHTESLNITDENNEYLFSIRDHKRNHLGVDLLIQSNIVRFCIDTMASVNVIDEKTYNYGHKKPVLENQNL